ncbi:MAG: hypothetical protein JKY98_00585 [Gammaproteobacteria bacterium]|nr:hypothetical protein [Gammaproteobacteria bacterium]
MKKSTSGNWRVYLAALALLLSTEVSWAQQHDHDAGATDAAGQQEHSGHERSDGDSQEMMHKGDGKGMMMDHEGGHEGMMQRMQQMMQKGSTENSATTSAGQDAFTTIKEIVSQLEADTDTDWSKVDINALREHLIDMHHVTLYASVVATEVEGGAEYSVTGEGRTLAAILNMIPVHASQINDEQDWSVQFTSKANGVDLTITGENPEDANKIRALGFIGFMVQGDHHQDHHLVIARGAGADHDHTSGHSH